MLYNGALVDFWHHVSPLNYQSKGAPFKLLPLLW